MEEAAGADKMPVAAGVAAGANKVPAGAAAARAPAWTRVSAPVTWAGSAAPPAGALLMSVAAAAAAAAPALPAWARPSARLMLVLAAALYLVGCAEAGLALHAMIHPPRKGCSRNAASLHTASQYMVLAMSAQVIAFPMALAPPAWSVAVSVAVLGALITYYFPAHDVLWLLASCDDGAPALAFWLIYVVVWPAAFAIVAGFSLKSEIEDR